MKFKSLDKEKDTFKKKSDFIGVRKVNLKTKKSPVNKQQTTEHQVRKYRGSIIPKPNLKSLYIRSNFHNKLLITGQDLRLEDPQRFLSLNSTKCSSLLNCSSSTNLSRVHHYSIKTFESEKDHISDKSEILYWKYIQTLFETHLLSQHQSLQCNNLLKEIEFLSEHNENLKIQSTTIETSLEKLMEYENYEKKLNTEVTQKQEIFLRAQELVSQYEYLNNLLDLESNKLRVINVYPSIQPSEGAEIKLEDITYLGNLLKEARTKVDHFMGEITDPNTNSNETGNLSVDILASQKELCQILSDCSQFSTELDDLLSLETDLRALALVESENF